MASGAAQHDSANVSDSRSAKLVAYEHFIETQLRKTASSVKAVDLIGALMTMAAASLVYLFTVALLDHWIVPGGLGRGGRYFFLAGLLVAGGVYFTRYVLPLLIGRINPLYSAHTIEQSTPTLKNSLLNFLLFRRDREALPEPVFQALEVQAAKRLSAVHVDAAIDRSKIVRIGYVLLGVVIAYALYMVVSPKNPLATAGRVLLPWADIQAPSRVTIQNVEPGNALRAQAVLRGGKLTISAEVLGVEPDESVTLYYTSTDAQAVDRAIPMFVPEGALRYECQLPEPDSGLYVDFDYRIEAGDAISPSYHVEVVARPQIVVESANYVYPKYTHLSDHSVADQGDLKALEGTRVTVRARANYPIGSAWIDFDADGRSDLVMKTTGDEATASFVLKLSEDRRSAWHKSYSLRFSNQQGRRNREPVQYQIEVTPDLAPEITILAPKEEEIEVPLDGEVIIEAQAVDPDFALRQVRLYGAVSGRQVLDFPLLDAEHQGQWNHKYRLIPRRAGLKAGDLVEVWAEAQDNKSPRPNLAKTSRSRRLRIIAPEKSRPSSKPQPQQQDQPKAAPKDPSSKDQQDPKSEKPPEEQEGQSGSEAGQEGSSGEGEQGGGSEGKSGKQDEQGEGKEGEGQGQQEGGSQGKPEGEGQEQGEGSEEGVANDGSDDGGAFQKILKQLQEEQGKGEKPSPKQGQQEGSPDGGTEGQRSEGSDSGQKPEGSDGGKQGTGQSEQTPGGNDPGSKNSPSKGQPEGGKPDSDQQGKPSSADGSKTDSGSEAPSEGQSPEKQPGGSEKPSEGDSPGKQPDKQDSPSGQSPDDKSAAGEKGDSQGQGAKSKQQGAEPNQKKPSQEEQRPGAKGGDGNNEKGNSGAGKQGSDDAGSPSPEPGTTPKNNKKPGQGNEEGGKDKPKSPAHGNKESNSDGSEGGDKPGGGEEGGGQKADRRGTGSAGQNTASDEGGGQAEESGKGDTSEKSGNDVKSDRSSDDPGQKQSGKGSKQQPGSKPSGSESPDSDQSGQGKTSPQNDAKRGKQGKGRPSAGKSGDERPNEPSGDGQVPESEPGGDDADLEYARKATDLVLDHLEHNLEKDQVDKDMLDKLGWSKDDLQKFVQRWKNMKQDSRSSGAKGKAARRELDQALRSLGLGSGNVTRDGTRGSDNQRNLRESHRIPPPPAYAEQLKAYRRGLSETGGSREND